MKILSMAVAAVSAVRALNILVIGDYGWTRNMTDPDLNFDALNAYVGNLSTPVDFILTTGDNLYVLNEEHPTDAEADLMMSLFSTRPHLKDLEIWPVLGNHDCYALDRYFQVKLAQRYPTWHMPNIYHAKTYYLGHGKKFGLAYVDSCLAICSSTPYGVDDLADHPANHQLMEMKRLRDVKCGDPEATDLGN